MILLLLVLIASAEKAAVDFVLCKEPVLTTVAVDKPVHRFFPYFVLLHQCHGSWYHESPNIKHCVATKSDPIKITAYNTAMSWKKTEITMFNHTRCGPACKASPNDCDHSVQRWNNQTCKCDCLYVASPPPESVIRRKEGFRWSQQLCRCECAGPHAICSFKKTWSRENCACVGDSFYKLRCEVDNKHMDLETCECKSHRSVVSCNFDKDMCGWIQDKNDKFDWTRNRGNTTTSKTGPDSDHTTGSGYFMYIETSSPRVQGDNAKLHSTQLHFSGSMCLSFYYHMHGASMGSLKVSINNTDYFTAIGDKGNQWLKANVDVNLSGHYAVTFEGFRGFKYQGDIAIYDFKLAPGRCSSATR